MVKGKSFIMVLLCLLTFCSMVSFAMPLTSKAKINTTIQRKYESLELKQSADLMSIADKYLKSQKQDSALVCFSIVANRYKESMSNANKSECANAYYRCGTIFVNRYNDYTKALQNLQTALDVAKEAGEKSIISSILIYMGNIYVFYADQHNSDEMMAKGFDMYRQAMHTANEQKQWNNLLMAFGNIASCSPDFASKMDIQKDIEYFKLLDIPAETPLLPSFRTLADGLTHMSKHRYLDAIPLFEKSVVSFKKVDDEGLLLRYQFIPLCHISECYILLGNTDKALSTMHGLEKRALALNLKDLVPEIYSRLEDIYHMQGNTEMEKKYHLLCLEEKDSLMHAEGLEGVKDTHFLHELNKLDEQLKESSYHRERQRILLSGGAILLAGILVFLLVVYRKNRQLNARNKALYDRVQDLFHESHSPLRQVQESYQDKLTRTNEKEASNNRLPKKSSTDNLSDEQKTALVERLRLLLSDTDVLCATDLSEQNLAQQMGTNSAYLSKAVNEVCNCNFNTFINNMRVKEACRRIDDKEHFGQFSMEGIGLSVGFNSRSTFTSAFKRVTGLTPSEYQRVARKNA